MQPPASQGAASQRFIAWWPGRRLAVLPVLHEVWRNLLRSALVTMLTQKLVLIKAVWQVPVTLRGLARVALHVQ